MRLLIVASLLLLGSCESKSEGPSDLDLITVGQEEVKKVLRDPASAQFSGVRVSRKAGVPAICGQVNSNNGFGGKTGPQRFISGGATVLEEQMAPGEMDKSWALLC